VRLGLGPLALFVGCLSPENSAAAHATTFSEFAQIY
jgi:hypothetical protein